MSVQSKISEPGASGGGSSGANSVGRKKPNWSAVKPPRGELEDRMSDDDNAVAWGKIYAEAGARTETEMEAVRAGVYVYGANNGTSRVGSYSKNILWHGGHKFPASCVPAVTGTRDIRRFFRANAAESYEMFKETRCMESEADFVAKAARFGASPSEAFAIADWLRQCHFLTPREAYVAEEAFKFGVRKAAASRGGHTLEAIEKNGLDEELVAQSAGAGHDSGNSFEF